jgi:rubrerythrin
MNVFQASDILEFAIRIEENGANFYRYAVQLAKDEETKKLFEHLAEEEMKHKRTFEKIFAAVDKGPVPESYDGEYIAYLHNYVDNSVIFKKEVIDSELAKVKDTVSALDFAIRRELDSITYYHEIKGIVPAAQHDAIDKIIAEERRHYTILCTLKKKVTG